MCLFCKCHVHTLCLGVGVAGSLEVSSCCVVSFLCWVLCLCGLCSHKRCVVWVDVCQCPFGMVMHSGVLSVLG